MKNKRYIFIIGLIIITAFIGIYLYITNPKYSIKQIRTAYVEHDITKFKKYFDLDGVISNILDQVIIDSEIENQNDDEMERLGQNIGIGFAKIMAPQLKEKYKREISKLIENGDLQNIEISKDFSLYPLFKTISNLNDVSKINEINKTGKIVHIGIEVNYEKYDTILVFDLMLRNKGKYWQIADIPNLLLNNYIIDDLETKRIENLNNPIINKMDNTFSLLNFNKSSYNTGFFGLNKEVKIEFDIKNIGDKPISEYEIEVHLSDFIENELNKTITVRKSEGVLELNQKEKWKFKDEINSFINQDNLLYKTHVDELNVFWQVNYILFNDNTNLKLYEKWDE